MPTAIAVHGGAGRHHPDDDAEAAQAGCREAALEGHRCLLRGGSALDAVEAAVRVLEDNPLFNAGTGACLTRDGEVELDAMVMDGATEAVGSVALVRGVPNPVSLARAVMAHTPHAFLAGRGAEALARTLGLPTCAPEALVTPRARARLEAFLRGPQAPGHGTVGAVALDAKGNLAAATSTGGTVGKWPGRIGDTPLPGAGTYARNGWGAASATGRGEPILRVLLGRDACERLARGVPVARAAEEALEGLRRVDGEAGLLLLAPDGSLGLWFTTERMAHAWVDTRGVLGSGF